jgi:hypothetical protein
MNRFAAAALVIVFGLGVAFLVNGLDATDTPTAAQSDQATNDETSEFVPQRPGQLADPGEPRFSTRGWVTDFGISSVPFSEIFSGGVPKDGIPAVDDPQFESIEAARGWLSDESPVVAFEIDGDARAYPLAILTWHEIANDVVGDTPVIVTFCPLCHTALVYERTIDGELHDFGVSGNLRFSDMVMYDRQTETWWQQATGIGIVGDQTGTRLEFVPSQIIGLAQFEEAYPDGMVMSRETGHTRRYGQNPYTGYDTAERRPFLFFDPIDGRMPPMERVITLGGQDGRDPLSFPYTELRKVGAANTEFESQPIAAFWVPGAVSALDEGIIDRSEDVGATGVYFSTVDDQTLTFARDGEGDAAPIVDAETGSTWDITGRAIAGPLEGTRLEPVGHGDHFWFAWAAFVPDTAIWTTEGITTINSTEDAA